MPKSIVSIPDQQPARAKWHALWSRSNCEQILHDALLEKGFDVFLPKVGVWSRRAGRRHLVPAPMFPGYLFLRHAMDKVTYIEISRTNGFVAILGERWDRLAVVPDPDIAAIQQALRTNLPVLPHPVLAAGQRVLLLAEEYPSGIYSWRRANSTTIRVKLSNAFIPGVTEHAAMITAMNQQPHSQSDVLAQQSVPRPRAAMRFRRLAAVRGALAGHRRQARPSYP